MFISVDYWLSYYIEPSNIQVAATVSAEFQITWSAMRANSGMMKNFSIHHKTW